MCMESESDIPDFELNGTMFRILVRIGSALDSSEYHSRVALGELSV